jgi:hypothetical protein
MLLSVKSGANDFNEATLNNPFDLIFFTPVVYHYWLIKYAN